MKTDKAANKPCGCRVVGETCPVCKKPAAPQSSPLPWIADKCGYDSVTSKPSRVYSKGVGNVAIRVSEADAALIVRRVNQGPAFDALLIAVREVVKRFDDNDATDALEAVDNELRAALNLAQEVR